MYPFSADQMTLYVARRRGQWLMMNTSDLDLLKQGEVRSMTS